MIYPGTDLKYRITTTIPGFVIADHNFKVILVDRYGRVLKEAPKSDCFADSEGQWYFTLEAVRQGPIFARFYADIPDKDYNKQIRVISDVQLLCIVGPQPRNIPGPTEEHQVTYEQVWTVDLDDGTYLADENGNLVLVDGRRVRFPKVEGTRTVDLDMSGQAFKTLIEGQTDDGKINTIPEVMGVMGGLDEDTELTAMTNQDVDDMMNRILHP